MKFTVVIPVYNGANYIKKSINSVLNQTFDDIELIVVNDGSTDDTEKIVNELFDVYEGKKKTLYFAIKNSGPSTARNIGIENATGEYICFLDSDDSYTTNLFSDLSKKLNGQDVCFFGWEEKYEDSDETFSIYTDKFKFLNGEVDGITAAKMKFKKEIWLCNCNEVYALKILRENDIRYPEGIYSAEDSNFIYKCLMNAKSVCCLNSNAFINYYRNNSLMHSCFSPRALTEFIAQKALYEYSLNTFDDNELKDMMFTSYYYSRISVAKRIAKSMKCYQGIKYAKECKTNVPKIKKERKVLLTKKQRLECALYKFSKILFLIVVKLHG